VRCIVNLVGPIVAILLVAAAFTVSLPGQGISPIQGVPNDEIRWTSRPYVPQPPNTIRVNTNVVQVPVVVRDEHGKAVAGLKKSDFELYDNGHAVEISSFAIENTPTLALQNAATSQGSNITRPASAPAPSTAPPPRYIVLFFDDTSMRVFDIVPARKAAENFVKTSLKPGDRIGIFTTSTIVSLDFTDNVPKLLETLAKLESHRRRADSAGSRCAAINVYQAYMINQGRGAHSDAFDLAAVEGCGDVRSIVMAAENIRSLAEQFGQETLGVITDAIHYLGRMPGSRLMVLVSSGFWTQTLAEEQNKLIDEALDANVMIDSLDAKGLVAEVPGQNEDGQILGLPGKWVPIYDKFQSENREYQNDPLALIAEGTGGTFFHNQNDLALGLRSMIAAPDVSYMLSFSPVDLKANGSVHGLKVKVPSIHGANIQARRGYMAPSATPTESERKKLKLERAVISTSNFDELTAKVTTEQGTPGPAGQNFNVAVHVAVDKLPFQMQGDRKVERLIFVAALFDGQDKFVSGVEGVMDLRLKKETLATLALQGLDARLSLQAPPGSYRLRQIVQEEGTGRLAAMNNAVNLH
jgi:VWFA-related protein